MLEDSGDGETLHTSVLSRWYSVDFLLTCTIMTSSLLGHPGEKLSGSAPNTKLVWGIVDVGSGRNQLPTEARSAFSNEDRTWVLFHTPGPPPIEQAALFGAKSGAVPSGSNDSAPSIGSWTAGYGLRACKTAHQRPMFGGETRKVTIAFGATGKAVGVGSSSTRKSTAGPVRVTELPADAATITSIVIFPQLTKGWPFKAGATVAERTTQDAHKRHISWIYGVTLPRELSLSLSHFETYVKMNSLTQAALTCLNVTSARARATFRRHGEHFTLFRSQLVVACLLLTMYNNVPQLDDAIRYFKAKHPERKKPQWQLSQSLVEIECVSFRGQPKLEVSAYQAAVMMLFNRAGPLARDGEGGIFEKLTPGKTAESDDRKDIARVLAQLVKFKILMEGKERGSPNPIYTLNKAWHYKVRRLNGSAGLAVVPSSSGAGSDGSDDKELRKQRQFMIKACLARIMKSAQAGSSVKQASVKMACGSANLNALEVTGGVQGSASDSSRD